jgi:hypothetical protein
MDLGDWVKSINLTKKLILSEINILSVEEFGKLSRGSRKFINCLFLT